MENANENSSGTKKTSFTKLVTAQLGEHNGFRLPGVQTNRIPYRIELQCHGHKDSSLNAYWAVHKKDSQWQPVEISYLLCGDLQHIHIKGYLQNDLQTHNLNLRDRFWIFNPITDLTHQNSSMEQQILMDKAISIQWSKLSAAAVSRTASGTSDGFPLQEGSSKSGCR